MIKDIYEQLAKALDKLPNGFHRTPSNVEILILKKIFSPEEASLASQLCGDMEPSNMIAEQVGLRRRDGGKVNQDGQASSRMVG